MLVLNALKPAATASDSIPIETHHEDMIVSSARAFVRYTLNIWPVQHDAQLDYYGKRLATCSSDRTVKVFDVIDGEPQKQSGGQVLKGCVPTYIDPHTK